jgi:hypothetical protein
MKKTYTHEVKYLRKDGTINVVTAKKTYTTKYGENHIPINKFTPEIKKLTDDQRVEVMKLIKSFTDVIENKTEEIKSI